MVRNGILESNIIIEVGSAANEIKNTPSFQNLIQNVLKEGDTIVVTKIDRCARNTLEFLKLQDILLKKNIQFISLDLPYSEDRNVNKLISITLSSIAEFENNRRKERQMQGISAAKKAGKYRGRKTVIDDKLISEVKHLKQQKMLSVRQIVKITGRSRNTIYKVLKEHLGYVSNRLVKNDEIVTKTQFNGAIGLYFAAKSCIYLSPLGGKKMNQNNFSFNSENLLVDWISFNLEGLMDPRIIARRLLTYFTPHVLIDDVPSIGFHNLKKSIRFLSVNIRDLKVTGLVLRLFSLEKMRLISISLSKFKGLIGIFSSLRSIL